MTNSYKSVLIGFLLLMLLASPLILSYNNKFSSNIRIYSQENKLIIYTYDYFFGLTNETLSGDVYEKLFERFEEKYGVNIEIRFFDGARNILLTAIQEYRTGVRTADLLIGLDNIVVQEAKKAGILEKIDQNQLENLSKLRSDLIRNFDPDLYGVPYDFGPIAFIYDSERIQLKSLKFEDFYNKTLASLLVTEDPTQSTTGISFLLWQIGIYDKLLQKDWREWWARVKDYIVVAKSWGAAYFDYFLNEEAGKPIVVSYLTSPVYHYLYENTTRYKPMLVNYDGNWYAWFQIQGVGIVKNSPMKDIAMKFIDWLLSDEIQEMIIYNDIMLPGNEYVLSHIPSDLMNVMAFNISTIHPVNDLIPVSEIYSNIHGWLREWKETMSPSLEFIWIAILSIVAIVAIIGVIRFKFKGTRR